MIEPQSAQLGASAWVWNETLVWPRFRVTTGPPPPFPLPVVALPLPFDVWPLAWPFEAMTLSSSFAARFGRLERLSRDRGGLGRVGVGSGWFDRLRLGHGFDVEEGSDGD